MKDRLITPKQKKWLVENYASLGIDKCASRLKLPRDYIKTKVAKMGLHLSAEKESEIRAHTWKKNAELFLAKYKNLSIPMNERVAYMLGLIWADGTIQQTSKWRYAVRLTLIKPDADIAFNWLPNEWGEWLFYTSAPQREKGQIQRHAFLKNRLLSYFFVETDYLIKSGASPDKVLKRIPLAFRPYFWLGYFDGDGCFHVTKKCNQFSVTSVKDQDWSAVENLFRSIGIKKFKIQRRCSKDGCHSKVRIANRPDLSLLISYLYKNYAKDQIGFPRKREKALSILSKIDTRFKANRSPLYPFG